ncbi:Uncharacterised protein r2_g4317 [Pycnogonum litorale]
MINNTLDDSAQGANETGTRAKPGRPKTEDIIASFYEKIKPELTLQKDLESRLSGLDALQPLLSVVDKLQSQIASLLQENREVKVMCMKQQERIEKLEELINSQEMRQIQQDAMNRRNSIIVKGIDVDYPDQQIINLINENSEESYNIKQVEVIKLGKETNGKQLLKVNLPMITKEAKSKLMKANLRLRAEKVNIRFDVDRSPAERKMNATLLQKRWQLKQSNPSIMYKIRNNLLVGSDNTKYKYDFVTGAVDGVAE